MTSWNGRGEYFLIFIFASLIWLTSDLISSERCFSLFLIRDISTSCFLLRYVFYGSSWNGWASECVKGTGSNWETTTFDSVFFHSFRVSFFITMRFVFGSTIVLVLWFVVDLWGHENFYFIFILTTCMKLNSSESSIVARVWRHYDETFGNFFLSFSVGFSDVLLSVSVAIRSGQCNRPKHGNVIRLDGVVFTHIQWLFVKGKLCFWFS